MAEEIVKSSAIMIATGDKVKVYRTLEDVPPELRRKLTASTSSLNSATVLIANRGGREKLRRALGALVDNAAQVKAEPPRRFHLSLRQCVEALAGMLIGLAIWLFLKRYF
jgi:hypothetical protein